MSLPDAGFHRASGRPNPSRVSSVESGAAAEAAQPSAGPRPPGERARRVRLVLILGSLSAFGPLSIDMYLPALPGLARDLHAGAAEAQLTLTACLAGLAAGQVVVGPLSDSLGRRRPLLVGLAAYAASSLLCAAAPFAGTLVALRLVQGAAGAAGIVISRAVVRDLYSGDAVARFFARLMLVTGLAPILAPVLGGQLLRVTSWRGLFVVLAGIGAVLLCAAAAGLPDTLPPDRRSTGGLPLTLRTFRRLLTDRSFVGYALAGGLAFAGMFAYIAGSPFVLEGVYRLSPQLFSVVFGTNAVGLVLGSQLSGRLVGKVPPRLLLMVGLAANATAGVGLLLVVVSGLGLPGVMPALFVAVASMGLIFPNSTALALAEQARVAGTASALLGVIQFVVGAVAAPLVGVAGTGTPLPMAVIMAGLSCAAMLAFALLPRRRLRLAAETAAARGGRCSGPGS